MISILERIFIGKNKDIHNPEIRQKYGMMCSIVGIFLNILLFSFKELAGMMTGSVAIVADGFNNLSDAGSSFLTMIGYKFAGEEPDTEHPFGHGRIEYLMGLIVSILIIMVGVELFRTSIIKIITPEEIETSLTAGIILTVSILVKLYMYSYNLSLSRKIDSTAMHATAMDSVSDALSTTVVLASMIVHYITGKNVDGICGLLVAIFIIYGGASSVKDTIAPLLGQPPTREFVDDVKRIVMEHPTIIGMHDLVVHDYGPGRVMISLHAEVSGDDDIYKLHDCIDKVERELKAKLGCEAVIHMDPVHIGDKQREKMQCRIMTLLKGIDPLITIHDLRIEEGENVTVLSFDVVVPPKFKKQPSVVKKLVEEEIRTLGAYEAVVEVDQSLV